MKVKTKLVFERSLDAVHGHVARIVVSGKELPLLELPPDETSVVVESNYDPDPKKSEHVLVLIAAVGEVNGKKVTSKAKAYEFITSDTRIPSPPGNVFMVAVEQLPNSNQPSQTSPARVMVKGHSQLYDGAIGAIVTKVGNGPNAAFSNGVVASFEPANVREKRDDNLVVELYPGDPSVTITVLTDTGNEPLETYVKK